MAIIGYCIIDGKKSLQSATGIEKKPTEILDYEDIAMVISEVASTGQELLKSIQNAHNGMSNGHAEHPGLRFNSVIDQAMKQETVLPLRFPTLFDGREAAESVLKSHYDDFRVQLDEIQGRIEYGIKVMWDGDQRKEAMLEEAKKSSYVDQAVLSGKAFLQKRYAIYKRDQQFRADGREQVEAIHAYLEDLIEDLNYQTLLSDNYLLNGSYLLPRHALSQFEPRLKQMEVDFPELKFIYSGPWAPFHFTEIELNV